MDGHKRWERLYQLHASPVNYAQQNPGDAGTGCPAIPAASNRLPAGVPVIIAGAVTTPPQLVRMCTRPIHYHGIYLSS